LDKVSSLDGVTFDWIDSYADNTARSPKRRQMGIMAQQVKEVCPEIISNWAWNNEKYMAVDYSKLVALLVEAVKELKEEVDSLKNQ